MKDILQEAVNALVMAKGNISEAARSLKLPRPTLNSRLEKAKLHNITPTVKGADTEAALTEQKLTYELQIKELKQQVDEQRKLLKQRWDTGQQYDNSHNEHIINFQLKRHT